SGELDRGRLSILADALEEAGCTTPTSSATSAIRGRTPGGAGPLICFWGSCEKAEQPLNCLRVIRLLVCPPCLFAVVPDPAVRRAAFLRPRAARLPLPQSEQKNDARAALRKGGRVDRRAQEKGGGQPAAASAVLVDVSRHRGAEEGGGGSA